VRGGVFTAFAVITCTFSFNNCDFSNVYLPETINYGGFIYIEGAANILKIQNSRFSFGRVGSLFFSYHLIVSCFCRQHLVEQCI
jgi:hypothetical protein